MKLSVVALVILVAFSLVLAVSEAVPLDETDTAADPYETLQGLASQIAQQSKAIFETIRTYPLVQSSTEYVVSGIEQLPSLVKTIPQKVAEVWREYTTPSEDTQ